MFERFTPNERLQHIILIISFTVLMITGFSLMFPASIWTIFTIALMGGFQMRGLIHRAAAAVFILLGIYHAYYILLTKRGKTQLRELLPALRDFGDFFEMLKYYFGLSKSRPRFRRFSYIEKSEYWALIWGALIMTATGFFLWAETRSIGLFTKLGYDIAKVIHGYEAILAALALLVWHMYHVHLNPADFPFKNKIWLDGKISREKMEHEHPLELEELEKNQPAR